MFARAETPGRGERKSVFSHPKKYKKTLRLRASARDFIFSFFCNGPALSPGYVQPVNSASRVVLNTIGFSKKAGEFMLEFILDVRRIDGLQSIK